MHHLVGESVAGGTLVHTRVRLAHVRYLEVARREDFVTERQGARSAVRKWTGYDGHVALADRYCVFGGVGSEGLEDGCAQIGRSAQQCQTARVHEAFVEAGVSDGVE
ncbi:hypothetical protein BpHYR1_010627 [Brachionus plicatilis]|uniref:Uncharacterized protein n=1 Tax=Brachionus plicatilis TaxID=10195 RepID=A0A3M7S784_BRAPC|nr:hypothetical protein BpHYR1_010627 [Brachionus plicatilis]